MTAPANEHEDRRALSEDVFYPDHPPRSESHTFRATKAAGHKLGLQCVLSGHTDKVEYHHGFVEWAFANAVDWHRLKAIATGQVRELPVLDIETGQPTDAMWPVERSLIYRICKFIEWNGFDWAAFDPDQPEVFVDGMAQMFPLHEKYHRGKGHGAHDLTFPIFIFQAFPHVPGYVFSPDELLALHKGAA